MRDLHLRATKRGAPALWEEGGGMRKVGEAVIVASPEGRPLRPVLVRTALHTQFVEHALLPVSEGCIVVEASHHRGEFFTEVFRLENLRRDADGGWRCTMVPIATFDKGGWDRPLPQELEAVVEAAKRKALCYHCTEPHFVETSQ